MRLCARCGRSYTPAACNQKHCHACRPVVRAEQGKASLLRCGGHVGFLPKPCAICGTPFTPTTSRGKYCEADRPEAKRRMRMDSHRRTFPTKRLDGNFITRKLMRRGIRRMIRQHRPSRFVNYTPAQLRAHIESLFWPGMTWDNYGAWHVDHKKALAKFSFFHPDGTVNEAEVKAACSLDNLQPLWAKDNLSKGAK